MTLDGGKRNKSATGNSQAAAAMKTGPEPAAVNPAVIRGRPNTIMPFNRLLLLRLLTHLAISSKVSWRLLRSVMLKFKADTVPVRKFGIV